MIEYGWEPDFWKRGGGSPRGGMPWATFRGWLDRLNARELARVAEETNRRQRENRRSKGGS